MAPPIGQQQPATSLERNVRVFGATSFFNDTASEMAYWILPAFLASIGASPAQLGVIEGIAESVASLAKLFAGLLTDRLRRRKPIVVAGYAVANAVKPALALASLWWQVLLVRFADRLSKGTRGAPRDVMVAESVGGRNVGAAYGLLQTMDSAGAIAGPLLALLIMSAGLGMRTVFWAAAIPGALAVIIVAVFARETGGARSTDTQERAPQIPAETRRDIAKVEGQSPASDARAGLGSGFYYLLLVVTLFSLGNSSDMFLVLRAQSVGIAARYAPLLGLVFNITYTAFSWPAGKLSDRMPRHQLAAAGYLVFSVVYAVFAKAPSRGALWVMMALYGGYYALTGPVLRAMVVDRAPRAMRGRAFGVFYSLTSIATLAASVLAGQLWKHYGPQSTLYLSAAVSLISALLLFAVPE